MASAEPTRLRLLLDTDSAENLIAYHAFRGIAGAQLELSNFQLHTAAGLVYPHGAAELQFYVLEYGRTYKALFWVVDTLAADALIGEPFIRAHDPPKVNRFPNTPTFKIFHRGKAK